MSMWQTVQQMAANTPDERNRYVDFLRAVSITVVIVGHWLIATSYYADGQLDSGHLLKSHPQTQWLTWLFQVMPIFFIVGGYSNAVSLESAARKGTGYGGWLAGRLNRLVAPLLVLIVAWAGIGLIMAFFGARPNTIQYASQASLIPTWFLAIYIMVVILAPLTYRIWQRYAADTQLAKGTELEPLVPREVLVPVIEQELVVRQVHLLPLDHCLVELLRQFSFGHAHRIRLLKRSLLQALHKRPQAGRLEA